jgi:hypothetical protein
MISSGPFEAFHNNRAHPFEGEAEWPSYSTGAGADARDD